MQSGIRDAAHEKDSGFNRKPSTWKKRAGGVEDRLWPALRKYILVKEQEAMVALRLCTKRDGTHEGVTRGEVENSSSRSVGKRQFGPLSTANGGHCKCARMLG